MKQGILFWVYGNSMETETTKWSEFPNGGRAIVQQILVSEERKKFKRAGLFCERHNQESEYES